MSDPLSVAGSAAGLVSLGLQVCGGIAQYLDALDYRDQDISSARQQNDSLRKALQVVETSLAQLQSEHRAAAAVVRSCIDSCQKDIEALDALVSDLAGSSQSTAGRTAKIRSQGKKLLYPFSRPKLQQLETKLQRANATLQLALQGLELSVSRLGAERLATLDSRLESASLNISASLLVVQSEVSAMGTPLRSIQNTVETRLDKLEHLVTQLLVQNPADGRGLQEATRVVATRRLLGKPGVLKDICDAAGDRTRPASRDVAEITAHHGEQLRGIASSHLWGALACSCRSRRRLQRKDIAWGSLSFFSEKTAEEHLPGCPAALGAGTDRTRKLGLKYSGLRRLLNSAVQVSFEMASGAGGLSLSPNFTYYPTVDAESAPAFQILNMLAHACEYLSRGGETSWQLGYNELARTAAATIVKLFQTKRASPRAVDAHNRSLVHYLAGCINICDEKRHPDCNVDNDPLFQLLKYLIAYKAPSNDYDTWGMTPIRFIFGEHPIRSVPQYRGSIGSVPLAAAELIFESSGVNLATLSGDALDLLPSTTTDLLMLTPVCISNYHAAILGLVACPTNIAEAYGCGPLGLAILANDRDEVERLLRHHPGTLNERNMFSQTPLHLAADKPLCLQLLVQAAEPALLNELDHHGMSALETAVAVSGVGCRVGRSSSLCCRCRCAECAVALLNADCAVPLSAALPFVFSRASQRCKRIYARHLKDRRERLRQFALANLSSVEAERLGLLPRGGSVLDSAAPRVFQFLQLRNVRIPDALAVWKILGPALQSVYQVLQNPRDADYFFQLGFRDTHSLWEPVARVATSGLILGGMEQKILAYLQWLGEHGADPIFYPLSSFGAGGLLLTAHGTFWAIGSVLSGWRCFNLADLGRIDRWLPVSCRAWIRELHATALTATGTSNMADNCRCRCSTGGCTPLTYLLKGLVWFGAGTIRYNRYIQPGRPASGAARAISIYLELFGDELELRHHTAALRYLTFSALEAPHTCCIPPKALRGEDCDGRSEDDISEVEDEHKDELALLEEVLDEFGPEVVEIVQDPDRGIAGLIDFYKQAWVARMEEVRGSLDGNDLADHERRGAEEIGVTWCEPELEASGNPYAIDTLEYWRYELEEIEAGCQ